jgi:hypothetical protein
MELTNEIKQKLIYQYFGQKYFYKNEFGTYGGIVGEYHTNEHIRNEFFVLRLRQLSEITNEDAIEVAKIVQPNGKLNSEDGKAIVSDLSEFELTKMMLITQYLQSKGYDMPQYLLGGKTLKEVGLAVYYK